MAKVRFRSFGRTNGFSQGGKGLDLGVVPSDPDLIPANISSGVDILGVTGTLQHKYTSGTTLTLATANTSRTNATTSEVTHKRFTVAAGMYGTCALRYSSSVSGSGGTSSYIRWYRNGTLIDQQGFMAPYSYVNTDVVNIDFAAGDVFELRSVCNAGGSGVVTIDGVMIRATAITAITVNLD
jgi:hypothetical protein